MIEISGLWLSFSDPSTTLELISFQPPYSKFLQLCPFDIAMSFDIVYGLILFVVSVIFFQR